MKNAKLKFIACFLCMLLAVSAMGGVAMGVSAEGISNSGGLLIGQPGTGVSERLKERRELKTQFKSEMVLANEVISAEIFFDDKVTDYYFVETGMSVITDMHNLNNLRIEMLPEGEFGMLEVFLNFGDGVYQRSTVYTYATGGKVFVSDISKDTAWAIGMQYKFELGLITMQEIEASFVGLFGKLTEIELSGIQPGGNTVDAATAIISGTLLFEPQLNASLPLRYAKVELYKGIGIIPVATMYTGSDGKYSFTVNSDGSYFIKAYPYSQTLAVTNTSAYYLYSKQSETKNVLLGGQTVIDAKVEFSNDLMVNKSFSVAQGMVVGQRFATAMGMSTNKILNVNFPSIMNSCCFGEQAEINGGDFNNWDVLTHEYGHFSEYVMGTLSLTLVEYIFNWPVHYPDTDHFFDKADKTFAMELTWSEAWATAFGQIAQIYYKAEYASIIRFADIKYGLHWDIETPTYNTDACEAQEYAVTAFLWDLYDNTPNEGGDNIGLDYFGWWNATTRAGTYTLTDFVEVIEYSYPHYRSQIGEIMGKYQIAPSNVTITNAAYVSATVAPQLSWRPNGSINNPNDRFQVVFYDQNNNLIGTVDVPYPAIPYDGTFTYNVPNETWSKVVLAYNGTKTINIAVRGYHTKKSPVSGPYVSKYVPVTIASATKQLTVESNNRYTELVVALNTAEYMEYTVTFQNSGVRVIQTFGTKDTYLELYSSGGALLKSDDDAGYSSNALISYDFAANTQYKIRVKFYSGAQSGVIRLAITPAVSLATYENITVCPDYLSGMNVSLTLGKVNLYTYTPSSKRTTTMHTESNIDAFLYLIDPSSTDPVANISGPSLFSDDDGGSYQAKITKTLEAGVPYLIILTVFNPAATSGSVTLRYSYI